jgi:hypothetical protein
MTVDRVESCVLNRSMGRISLLPLVLCRALRAIKLILLRAPLMPCRKRLLGCSPIDCDCDCDSDCDVGEGEVVELEKDEEVEESVWCSPSTNERTR